MVWQELQDRIDELQAELRDFHSLGRVHQQCNNPLSEELESKSPGMESDPGGTHCVRAINEHAAEGAVVSLPVVSL